MSGDNRRIVAVGEVVWDIFPDRQVLGGAPVNAAYHLQKLGRAVTVITRIGEDDLGAATLARLEDLGLATAGIQRDSELATGRVMITLGPEQEPHFEIMAPAAWDRIDPEAARLAAGEPPFALLFGTLAQRDPRSREAIRHLAQTAAPCFYDVNLRPPFTSRELVLASLGLADLVKMNGRELAEVGGWHGWPGATKEDAKNIAKNLCARYDLAALAVTEGGQGAWAMTGAGDFFEAAAEPVRVVDTVGAGDAFFAALIDAFLAHHPWPEILARANRLGGRVASQPGATP